jgi:hypothetical protein
LVLKDVANGDHAKPAAATTKKSKKGKEKALDVVAEDVEESVSSSTIPVTDWRLIVMVEVDGEEDKDMDVESDPDVEAPPAKTKGKKRSGRREKEDEFAPGEKKFDIPCRTCEAGGKPCMVRAYGKPCWFCTDNKKKCDHTNEEKSTSSKKRRRQSDVDAMPAAAPAANKDQRPAVKRHKVDEAKGKKGDAVRATRKATKPKSTVKVVLPAPAAAGPSRLEALNRDNMKDANFMVYDKEGGGRIGTLMSGAFLLLRDRLSILF